MGNFSNISSGSNDRINQHLILSKTGLNESDTTQNNDFITSHGLFGNMISLTNIRYRDRHIKPYWLRIVTIPNNTRAIYYNWYVSWVPVANYEKCILSEKYQLYSIKAIKKFNLEITDDYIIEACFQNKIDILEWLKNNKLDILLKYDTYKLDDASYNGNIDVLTWWKNSGLPLKYSERALTAASRNNKINVLTWWKNSGLPLKYSEEVLEHASVCNRIEVLTWWKESGLPLKYDQFTLRTINEHGHIEVLKWWVESGLLCKYIFIAF